MTTKSSAQYALLMVLGFHITQVKAQEQNSSAATVGFELSAGTEYDSNLNVVELDKNSRDSDVAALLNAKMDASWMPAEKLSLSGGYSYSSKTYQENKNYNLAIHQFSADAHYDFAPLTLGGNFHRANAILDRDSFLDFRQTSFYASKLINNKTYLRFSANNQDKIFPGLSARNATNQGFSADVFFFSNNGKTLLNIGAANEMEDARAKQYDYNGVSLKTKIAQKFTLWNRDNKFQLGYRYFKRDYSSVTPDIKVKRHDKGNTAEAAWEISLTQNISLEATLEKGNYASNLAAADYSETRASLLLKTKF